MGKKKPEHCWQSLHYKNIFNFTVLYIMQALVVPDPVLSQVNRILFRFLWRKKDSNRKAFEKVKRTGVCGALENGGLNMIDLKPMHAAFLLQWVGRLVQAQALDKWSHVPKNIFAPFGGKYLCFFSNLKSRALRIADDYLSLLEMC